MDPDNCSPGSTCSSGQRNAGRRAIGAGRAPPRPQDGAEEDDCARLARRLPGSGPCVGRPSGAPCPCVPVSYLVSSSVIFSLMSSSTSLAVQLSCCSTAAIPEPGTSFSCRSKEVPSSSSINRARTRRRGHPSQRSMTRGPSALPLGMTRQDYSTWRCGVLSRLRPVQSSLASSSGNTPIIL